MQTMGSYPQILTHSSKLICNDSRIKNTKIIQKSSWEISQAYDHNENAIKIDHFTVKVT